jgi:GTP pyrophosphokinase
MTFPLGPRFQEALTFAAGVHTGQFRKGTRIPYVAHVLAVAARALEAGADEDVACACLLHDAVEDGGGLPVLETIRQRFGPVVADLVMECTDATTTPKPPWRGRKEAYLAHLAVASPGARLVVLCDKLHNATSIVRDLREVGPSLWDRFNAGPGDTAWYYRSVVEILAAGGRTPLLDELDAVVSELERAVTAF